MLSINPGTNFPIVRKLGDPADVGTNYVRAVVRNSATGVILETINLVDQGVQRFTSFYKVGPAEDWFFDITTTVYTDSGYTTKSDVYSEENDTYHVQVIMTPQLQNVALQGGGSDINYKKIESIVRDVVEGRKTLNKDDITNSTQNLAKKDEIVNTIATLRKDIMASISSISSQIKVIKIPETDLKPLTNMVKALEGVFTTISNKKIDVSELQNIVSSSMNRLENQSNTSQTTLRSMMDSIKSSVETLIQDRILNRNKKILELKDTIVEIFGEAEKVTEERKTIDEGRIKKLIGK